MRERIEEELALLRTVYPHLNHKDQWVLIPSYPLPAGWSQTVVDVALVIKDSYPGTPPYGIYVPAGLRFKGASPSNYTEPASEQPPFGGTWGIFSWQPEGADWRPTADLSKGANLLNWVQGFAKRFQEGA